METSQENKLTLTEQALYCAQLTQWAVLSSDKNLNIICYYNGATNELQLKIYPKGFEEYANKKSNFYGAHELIHFFVDELTPSKIKTIQKQIAKILNDAVVY